MKSMSAFPHSWGPLELEKVVCILLQQQTTRRSFWLCSSCAEILGSFFRILLQCRSTAHCRLRISTEVNLHWMRLGISTQTNARQCPVLLMSKPGVVQSSNQSAAGLPHRNRCRVHFALQRYKVPRLLLTSLHCPTWQKEP